MTEPAYQTNWELRFHYTAPAAQGTKSMDIYSLVFQGKQLMIVMAIPQGAKELPQQIMLALNGTENGPPTKANLATLKEIFYGPWSVDPLTKLRYVRVSEAEEKTIMRIVFHEGAEKHMAQANYENLKREHEKLQKMFYLQGQQLLRAQAAARVELADFQQTRQPELFEPTREELKSFLDNSDSYLGNGNFCANH